MREHEACFCIDDFPIACTYQKLLFDDNKNPYDYEIICVNTTYKSLFQKSSSNLAGKTFRSFAPYDESLIDFWIEQCAQAVSKQSSYDKALFDSILKKWTLAKVIAINSDHFLIMYTDIPNEILTNAEIEGFFTSNLDLMCIFNMQGKFLKLNKEFENVLGYTIEELEDTSFIPYLHEDDLASTMNTMDLLKKQKPVQKFVNKFRCKDGDYRSIEWKAQALCDYVYASGRDISDLLETQRELERKNVQLAKLTDSLKEANAELESIATKDKLTGLYNRYYFDQKLLVEMESSDTYNHPLSMLIYDLDHFKKVNDTFGHPVGDDVLTTTAFIFLSAIRLEDMAFRIGGEEFCLLMPQTPLDQAEQVAERIRLALEEHLHPIVGKITASFGVAQRFKSESYKSWYNRVDECLYSSKQNGRNQVTAYNKDDLPIAKINIEWSENWNTGNLILNQQHKDIFELTCSIFHDAYANLDSEYFTKKIDLLIETIRIHFAFEESILSTHNYEALTYHKSCHASLLSKALRLKEDYHANEVKASIFFSFLLDELIMDHLLKEDTKFFPLFKS